MLHIIRTEWLKVKSYRTFWILLGVAVLFIPAINFATAEINSNIRQGSGNIINISIYDFPMVWQTMSNVNSYLVGFFGFVLVILVTNEFTFKTHRQNIIDGWDRKEFFLSKLFWVVALALLAFVVTIITGIIMGLAYGDNSVSFEGFHFVWWYLAETVLILMIAVVIGLLVRRAGLAIVLFLAYTMGIEQLLFFIGIKYVGTQATLLPMQSADQMMPFPFADKIKVVESYDAYVYAIALVVYISALVYWGYRKMQKADL